MRRGYPGEMFLPGVRHWRPERRVVDVSTIEGSGDRSAAGATWSAAYWVGGAKGRSRKPRRCMRSNLGCSFVAFEGR